LRRLQFDGSRSFFDTNTSGTRCCSNAKRPRTRMSCAGQ
jgi:hypothetical protein